ncbi:MAG: hypothetical protein OXC57_13695 [Rhodobacteraceae bacterium]|nr:hypothetical protein [Paracoccaceae bacterium]
MRTNLDHVVIHKGDETAFGEAEGISLFFIQTTSVHAFTTTIWKKRCFMKAFTLR